jgi:hypothetical protein
VARALPPRSVDGAQKHKHVPKGTHRHRLELLVRYVLYSFVLFLLLISDRLGILHRVRVYPQQLAPHVMQTHIVGGVQNHRSVYKEMLQLRMREHVR